MTFYELACRHKTQSIIPINIFISYFFFRPPNNGADLQSDGMSFMNVCLSWEMDTNQDFFLCLSVELIYELRKYSARYVRE